MRGPLLTTKVGTRMSRKLSLLALFLQFLLGCSLFEKTQEQHKFTMIRPEYSDELRYEDEDVVVRFTPKQKQIDFTVWNKTQAPMRIIWDEIRFLDPEGRSHWVLNSQENIEKHTRVAAGGHPLITPSVVPVGGSYSDYLLPFPIGVQEVLIYPTKGAKGSRFQVAFPLEIREHVKVYTFGFEIKD